MLLVLDSFHPSPNQESPKVRLSISRLDLDISNMYWPNHSVYAPEWIEQHMGGHKLCDAVSACLMLIKAIVSCVETLLIPSGPPIGSLKFVIMNPMMIFLPFRELDTMSNMYRFYQVLARELYLKHNH